MTVLIDSGLVDISGRVTMRAEDAQRTPTHSRISQSMLVYDEKCGRGVSCCPLGLCGGFASDIFQIKTPFSSMWLMFFAPLNLRNQQFEPLNTRRTMAFFAGAGGVRAASGTIQVPGRQREVGNVSKANENPRCSSNGGKRRVLCSV